MQGEWGCWLPVKNGSRISQNHLAQFTFGGFVYSCWPEVILVDDLQNWSFLLFPVNRKLSASISC